MSVDKKQTNAWGNAQKRHEQITANYGKHFCAAPWTSSWISPTGDVTFCCKSRDTLGNINQQNLPDILNSESANVVRKQMLAGGKPSHCRICWGLEAASGNASHNRVGNNRDGWANLDDAVAETNSDGSVRKFNISWFDLNSSNKCNFACLGCTPELSDTIRRNYLDEFANINGRDAAGYTEQWNNKLPEPVQFENDRTRMIDFVMGQADTLKQIHLNGGEPWMQAGFHELLDKLKAGGYHKTITLWTHTNGSISKYGGVDFVKDYYEPWTTARVSLSNDGCGKRGEFIRYGYSDRKWINTAQRLKQLDSETKNVSVQSCINSFNVLALDETAEFVDQHIGLPQTAFGPWSGESLTTVASLGAIDPWFKQAALEQLYKWRDKTWYSTLGDIISNVEQTQPMEQYLQQQYARKFVAAIRSLDSKRRVTLSEACPELIDVMLRLEQLGK